MASRRFLLGLIAAGLLLMPGPAPAQDTAAVSTADTLRSVPSPSGVDTIVTYQASDSIVYAVSSRTMFLYGDASLSYRDLGLQAAEVDINWQTAMLHAHGVADTTDTAGVVPRGLPVLKEAGETYNGSGVSYNFKSKKGKIDLGRTSMQDSYYSGRAIKKVGDEVLLVADGVFTSCDLDDPHYAFGSPEMKVFVGDKVVARPVVFYVSDVPVFAIPFGVFPVQRGRRSGLIAPVFGQNYRGRYLRNLGYYWAINDYLDWSLRTDLYAKGGYTFYSDFRYAVRYLLQGSLGGSFARVIQGEPGDPDYSDNQLFNIRFLHNQQFDPTTRLDVNFTFTSSSYYQETSVNLNDLLQQNIVSNATLTKSWEGTPHSLTLNVRRDQNLQPSEGDVEISDVLPGIIFNRSQTYPFRSSGASGSLRWYELIGFSYNAQALNRVTRTPTATGQLVEERRGIQHSLPISASPKVGYITVAPFFNYSEKWYDRRISRSQDTSGTLLEDAEHGFYAVRTFTTGIAMSTKLYGIFRPGILGITGIRHQVIPSISYSYQPDFSRPGWGYWGSYTDTTGAEVLYDRYGEELFGGAPAGERQAISFSLGNVLEMKTAGADTSAKENKFQLLNLNLNLGYNFAADSLRLSELGMDFRTAIGEVLSIGGNARFNFYRFQEDPVNPLIGRRVNEFLISSGGGIAQMTSFSISVGTRLHGEPGKDDTERLPRSEDTTLTKGPSRFVGLYEEVEPDFSIPWNLDLTWSFNQNQVDPRRVLTSSTIGAHLGFNLTQNWKISASANYDILSQQIAAPQITVYRDLHCWELNFAWVPTGQYRNYRVEIRLKTPMLRDLKVTKQYSTSGVY
jgi:lipopolysaccharide assembly outer membrane protein LptD (OstA)